MYLCVAYIGMYVCAYEYFVCVRHGCFINEFLLMAIHVQVIKFVI